MRIFPNSKRSIVWNLPLKIPICSCSFSRKLRSPFSSNSGGRIILFGTGRVWSEITRQVVRTWFCVIIECNGSFPTGRCIGSRKTLILAALIPQITLEEVTAALSADFLEIKDEHVSKATLKINRLKYNGPLGLPNSLKIEIDFL